MHILCSLCSQVVFCCFFWGFADSLCGLVVIMRKLFFLLLLLLKISYFTGQIVWGFFKYTWHRLVCRTEVLQHEFYSAFLIGYLLGESLV